MHKLYKEADVAKIATAIRLAKNESSSTTYKVSEYESAINSITPIGECIISFNVSGYSVFVNQLGRTIELEITHAISQAHPTSISWSPYIPDYTYDSTTGIVTVTAPIENILLSVENIDDPTRQIIHDAIDIMSSPNVVVDEIAKTFTLTFTPFSEEAATALSSSGIGQVRLVRKFPGSTWSGIPSSNVCGRRRAANYFRESAETCSIVTLMGSRNWQMPQVGANSGGIKNLNITKAELLSGSITRDYSTLRIDNTSIASYGFETQWGEHIGYDENWKDTWAIGFMYFNSNNVPTIYRYNTFKITHIKY